MNSETSSDSAQSGALPAAAVIGLLVTACALASLAILAWESENVRGKNRWEAAQGNLSAAGVSLNLADYVEPEVPAELNAMRHPVWAAAVLEKRGGGWWFFDPEPVFIAARAGVPEALFADDVPAELNAWASALGSDVEIEQSDAANTVLAATKAYETFSSGMDEAFRRPYVQWFDRDLRNVSEGWTVQMADFRATLKSLRSISRVRALAHLDQGDPELAARDLMAPLHVAESRGSDTTLLISLVRSAFAKLLVKDLENFLTTDGWSAETLRALQNLAISFDFVKDLNTGLRSECARNLRYIGSFREEYEFHDVYNVAWLKNYLIPRVMPQGWMHQNLANYAGQWLEDWIMAYDPTTDRLIPRQELPDRSEQRETPYTFIERRHSLRPFDHYRSAAATQSQWDLIALLCAVQRHRLETGDVPKTLSALAPNYIAEIPHDYVTGNSPHYEVDEDGQMTLFTLDWEQTGDPDKFLCKLSVVVP